MPFPYIQLVRIKKSREQHIRYMIEALDRCLNDSSLSSTSILNFLSYRTNSSGLLSPSLNVLSLGVVSILEIGQTVRTDFWMGCVYCYKSLLAYSMSDLNNIDLATDFYASSKYLIPDAIVSYNMYN